MSPNSAEKFWLAVPVAAPFLVTSRFNDPRNYPNAPTKLQKHEGVDLNAVDIAGRPVAVLAAQRGVVDRVDNFPPGYGQYVRIRHAWPDGNTYVSWYGHLSKIIVKKGDFVAAGQRIGTAGNTGNSFGIHLHLTVQHIGHGRPNYVVDDVIDPEPLFRFGPPPAVDECGFVADETIPDGTLIQPGQPFTKTWRVRNGGTASWGSGYQLVYFGGERLESPESVPLPALEPGQEGTVSVKLQAPSSAGRFQSLWKARNAAGAFFPFELFVEIVVPGSDLDRAVFLEDVTVPDGTPFAPGQTFLKTWRVRNEGTTTWSSEYQLAHVEDDRMRAPGNLPLPRTRPGEVVDLSVTLTAPDSPGSHQSTWRLRDRQGRAFGDVLFALIRVEPQPVDGEPAGRDEMAYVDDVTVEDGTPVPAGQTFEKIWRVRNAGTTTWGAGYELAFVRDDPMEGVDAIPLPAAGPGDTVDLAVTLTAPSSQGTHRSTWKGRNPDGEQFEHEMFAEIKVVRPADPTARVDDARFVRDVTVPDGAIKQAGESFLKTWRIRNVGNAAWDNGFVLAFSSDEPMSDEKTVPLPPIEPGAEANVSVRLTAPLQPGIHKSTWQPRSPEGAFFGHVFFAEIRVPEPLGAADDKNRAQLMEHETFKPGSEAKPGQRLLKSWRVRNSGTSTWENGYTLAHVEGDRLSAPASVGVPRAVPLNTVRLSVPLVMPATPGRYRSVWKLRDPQGTTFGPQLIISIEVKE